MIATSGSHQYREVGTKVITILVSCPPMNRTVNAAEPARRHSTPSIAFVRPVRALTGDHDNGGSQ